MSYRNNAYYTMRGLQKEEKAGGTFRLLFYMLCPLKCFCRLFKVLNKIFDIFQTHGETD